MLAYKKTDTIVNKYVKSEDKQIRYSNEKCIKMCFTRSPSACEGLQTWNAMDINKHGLKYNKCNQIDK